MGTGAVTGSGLAKALYDARSAGVSFGPGAIGAPNKEAIAKVCRDDASAIIPYLVENTVVSTTVTTTVPSPIPVTVVPATGIGATTGPGAGSGSGTGTIA